MPCADGGVGLFSFLLFCLRGLGVWRVHDQNRIRSPTFCASSGGLWKLREFRGVRAGFGFGRALGEWAGAAGMFPSRVFSLIKDEG